MARARDVAEWMASKLNSESYLIQEVACLEICERFGEQFTHLNDGGGNAINADVLWEFRKLTERDFVWSRGERAWRKRSESDQPGRKQE
jgi:uncharacterized protein DUF6953